MPTTPKGYRYPNGGDPAADLELFIRQLAEDVDASPGIRPYTQAQIDALPAAQKWEGRKVWNVTAGVMQNWNGAQWVNEGGSVDLSNYARKDQAQSFTENQTIVSGRHLLLGTAASLSGWNTSDTEWCLNSVYVSGTGYVRLEAENRASRLKMEDNGDLVFYTNADNGNTAGSVITWVERWRIRKSGAPDAKLVGFRGYRSTAFSTGHNATPTVPWEAESFDTDAFHAAGATDILIPMSGYYLCQFQATFAGNVNGTRSVTIQNASLGSYLSVQRAQPLAVATPVRALAVSYLPVGTTIRMFTEQSSGGNLNLEPGEGWTFGEVIRVGV